MLGTGGIQGKPPSHQYTSHVFEVVGPAFPPASLVPGAVFVSTGAGFVGLIGGRQREIECRSPARRRFHPNSTAVPFDGLLAKGESQPVAGEFFAVQALKHAEDTVAQRRIYSRTVVLHGEYPAGGAPLPA